MIFFMRKSGETFFAIKNLERSIGINVDIIFYYFVSTGMVVVVGHIIGRSMALYGLSYTFLHLLRREMPTRKARRAGGVGIF